MPHLNLGLLDTPGLLWWIALAAACGAGLWAYYRLAAPLSRPLRLLLQGLRVLALLWLLLLLLEPMLTLRASGTGRPRLAVLVDHSSSMQLPGTRGGTRRAEAESTLAILEARLGEKFDLDVFGFSTTLDAEYHEDRRHTWEPGGATALGDALQEVQIRQTERPLSGVVLLSDGVHTAGKDPLQVVRGLGLPVFAVTLGDTSPPADLLVREIHVHPVAHVDERVALRAVLQSQGLEGWEATVTVRERPVATAPARELARRTVRLGPQGSETELTLEIVPTRVGRMLVEVEAEVGPDEAVRVNNRRWAAIDVRERKTHVLYIEGEPDWDFAFLKRTFDTDTTLAYAYLVRQRDGGYVAYGSGAPETLPVRAADLAPYAAVIVGRCAPDDLPPGFVEALRAFLIEGGGVFLLGGGAAGGLERWISTPLGDLIPATVTLQPRRGSALSACQPTFQGLTHEITAMDENPHESERIWRAMPPVWIPEGEYRPAPAAAVLLTSRTTQPPREVPLLLVASAGAGRVGAMTGRGFWRWDFATRAKQGAGAAADFWRRVCRWLAEPTDQTRLAISPGRLVFQSGEPVTFAAHLSDSTFRPVDGAQVRVEIERAEPAASGSAEPAGADQRGLQPKPILLYPEGSAGRYAATAAPLTPGAYRYRAEAMGEVAGAREVWRAEGAFWVEPMGPEFLRLASSARTLAELARASGGQQVPTGRSEELLAAIESGHRPVQVVHQEEIWNHWLAFAFLTALLSAEWVVRRSRGLA